MKLITVGEKQIIEGHTPEEWHKLRSTDITSTDAAALFGISPYLTPYELWHRKKSAMIAAFEPSERMKWGTRLQDSIAAGIAEDNQWGLRRMDEYVRLPQLSMGASFDFCIDSVSLGKDDAGNDMRRNDVGLLEIKNVDAMAFKDGWILEDEQQEAPAHIELQVQHQLAVSGLTRAWIGALVGGNRVVLIRRDRDEDVISALKNRVEMFWKSIRDNVEPKPDFERDAKFIASLYRYSEPGKVMTATKEITEIAASYKAAGSEAKEWEAKKQAAKARILTLIGDAERVIGEGFSISAGMIGPCEVKYAREGYRDFRINVKKTKETDHAPR